MKKIGLFGGTFNPIHLGHLNLAFELMEKGGLDEVWFIPTPSSPLRNEPNLVQASQRLKMVELATAGIPQFKVLDIELKRPLPVYTIDTVREIKELYPDKKFFLLLGKDTLSRFMEWREPEALIQEIPLLIGVRSTDLPVFSEVFAKALENGTIATTQFEVSSTQIRERIKKGLYIGHLVPGKVLDFIYVNQLYFNL